MSPLTLAYLALVSALASGIVALGADRYPGLLRYGSSILLGACGLLAIVAGGWALLDETPHLDQLALGLPWLQWHLRLDVLSGFFFSVVGLLVLAVSFYAPGYLQDYTHAKIRELAALGFFTGLFILGMLLVLLADDAFVFMIAWELMSVSSYFLVAYQHQHAANRRAAFLYLLMAHVGGLAILLGFGVLAGFGGGYTQVKTHVRKVRNKAPPVPAQAMKKHQARQSRITWPCHRKPSEMTAVFEDVDDGE